MSRVVVFDYGTGNVHSAVKALELAGADVTLTSDRTVALEADGLVVPGVGAFSAVMAALKAVRGDDIVDRRLAGDRPVLGICVGMQVMFEHGVERGIDTVGLGEWPGIPGRHLRRTLVSSRHDREQYLRFHRRPPDKCVTRGLGQHAALI